MFVLSCIALYMSCDISGNSGDVANYHRSHNTLEFASLCIFHIQ